MMAQRLIYIVPDDSDPDEFTSAATDNQCGEIVVGVPPALIDVVSPDDLPTVYAEEVPDPPVDTGPSLADVNAVIQASPDLSDAIKAALAQVLAAVESG